MLAAYPVARGEQRHHTDSHNFDALLTHLRDIRGSRQRSAQSTRHLLTSIYPPAQRCAICRHFEARRCSRARHCHTRSPWASTSHSRSRAFSHLNLPRLLNRRRHRRRLPARPFLHLPPRHRQTSRSPHRHSSRTRHASSRSSRKAIFSIGCGALKRGTALRQTSGDAGAVGVIVHGRRSPRRCSSRRLHPGLIAE